MNNDGSQYGQHASYGLLGAQNALAPKPASIPTPQEMADKRALAIEQDVVRLCIQLRLKIREAMEAGQVAAQISFESTFDVAIETARRIEAEVKAAGWSDVDVRRSNQHVQVSWRQPPQEAEAATCDH